jgi:hypothetical protein
MRKGPKSSGTNDADAAKVLWLQKILVRGDQCGRGSSHDSAEDRNVIWIPTPIARKLRWNDHGAGLHQQAEEGTDLSLRESELESYPQSYSESYPAGGLARRRIWDSSQKRNRTRSMIFDTIARTSASIRCPPPSFCNR